MNKKGFAFVETIVTLTVLLVALTVLYTVFANLLNQEKVLSEYDSPADKYALFYIKQKWLADGKESSYNENQPSNYIDYNRMYNLEKLVVFKCDKNTNKITNKNKYDSSSDKEFTQFLNRINTCPKKSEFVFVGKFKNTSKVNADKSYDSYSFAHIYYPNKGNDTGTSYDEGL